LFSVSYFLRVVAGKSEAGGGQELTVIVSTDTFNARVCTD